MARPTLLDLTQRILSSMDSDSVNSISDTAEAEQVADIIRETYLDIIDEYDLVAQKTLFSLTASGTTSRPTHMTLPEGYHSVEWIAYDKRETVSSTRRVFSPIPYVDSQEFILRTNSRDSDATNVDVVSDPTNVEILIINDKHPDYYTTFDGSTFIFDSYDSNIDTTLQSSKTQAYGQRSMDLTITDTQVIDLPQELYTLLRNQARETCFEIFKEGAPAKIRQMANRSRVRAQRLKSPVRPPEDVNYGRKRRY